MDVLEERRVRTLRRWAWISALANAALIVTGGLVRLTKSGLGCPNWPTCDATLIPTEVHNIQVLIEFGNRVLTFVLIALSIATFLAARRVASPLRRRAVIASLAIAGGIIGQAVVGGITVLTKLNPWVVSLHLVLSLFLVAVCVWLANVCIPAETSSPPRAKFAAIALAVTAFISMWLGTIVTGAGPNSGDLGARRNGLDLLLAARIHAYGVWALVAFSIAAVVWWRGHRLMRLVVALLLIEFAQGAVGYWQYFNGLPLLAVALHMLGIAVLAMLIPHVIYRALRVGRPTQSDATPSTTASKTGTESADSAR